MSSGRGPVFLARRGYRQRRLADAARLMPIAAGVLMAMPLLWQAPADASRGDPGTATVMIYIFGLWAGLVVISALVSRHLRAGHPDPGAGKGGET